MTHAYQAILHALAYQVAGAAVWVWMVTLIALPAFNELVLRSKNVKALSIIQAVANGIKASPLYVIPVVKQIVDALATKPPVTLEGAEVLARNVSQR